VAGKLLRAVLDTNVVVSGLLWGGVPRALLQAARERRLRLYTSTPLLIELTDALARRKFTRKLAASKLSAEELATRYAALTTVVQPATIAPVAPDADDDAVLAAAVAAGASLLITGDKPLMGLRRYQGIDIVTPSHAMALLARP
jgi:uncharacterized protein